MADTIRVGRYCRMQALVCALAGIVGAVFLIMYGSTTLQEERRTCNRSRVTQYVVAVVQHRTPVLPSPSTTYRVYSEKVFLCTLEYRPLPVNETVFLYANQESTMCAYEKSNTEGCSQTLFGFGMGMVFYFALCIIYPLSICVMGKLLTIDDRKVAQQIESAH